MTDRLIRLDRPVAENVNDGVYAVPGFLIRAAMAAVPIRWTQAGGEVRWQAESPSVVPGGLRNFSTPAAF